MKAATAQASTPEATAGQGERLAEQVVVSALEKAGLARAGTVILYLSRAFAGQVKPALLAAARTAGCMEIAGCTAHGLFTENGWSQGPSVAALVLDATPARAESPHLAFCNHFPYHWREEAAFDGLLDSDGEVWQHARVIDHGCAEFALPQGRCERVLAPGLLPLGPTQTIDSALAYEVARISGGRALDNLRENLPQPYRDRLPFAQIFALTAEDQPGIPVLAARNDGSLVMGEMLEPGQAIRWALRLPNGAEQDLRLALDAAEKRMQANAFSADCALMFNCIGRGALFYGDEDRDLALFRERFPELPLLGASGSGQIVATPLGNRLFTYTAHSLLFDFDHV